MIQLEQRSNETLEEFALRKREAAVQNQRRADRMHEFAAEPRDVYADVVTFHDEHGVLRIGFHCTRPDSMDALGCPTIPVARVSIPAKIFRHYYKQWLIEDDRNPDPVL